MIPLGLLALAPSVRYVPYANARYGFSLERPTFLKAQRPPDNGDGQEFRSGGIALRAYGEMNIDGSTAENVLKDFRERAKSGKISLAVAKEGWYAFSYTKAGVIHYDKSYVGKETMRTVEFEYPVAEASKMGPIVAHVVRTFRPTPVARLLSRASTSGS